MANPRSAKRDIEKARQLKALHKRERRQAPHGGDENESEASVPAGTRSTRIGQDELLERLAALHERFADGAISFDAFEAEKSALVDQLEVD